MSVPHSGSPLLPRNWPKDWATKVWNVGGEKVTGEDVARMYLDLVAGRQPQGKARVRDHIVALLKRPGFIRRSQKGWEVNV